MRWLSYRGNRPGIRDNQLFVVFIAVSTDMIFYSDSISQGTEDERLPLSALSDKSMRAVLAYWESKRGDREMPPRAAIRPEEIGGALGRVNLIDVTHDPLRFRFRLIGTHVVQSFGLDPTGLTVDELSPPDYAELLIRHFTEAVAAREPVLHVMRFLEIRQTHEMHRLSLPLSDDGGHVDMLMTVSGFGPELQRFRERQRAAGEI